MDLKHIQLTNKRNGRLLRAFLCEILLCKYWFYTVQHTLQNTLYSIKRVLE
jgi:hypothetical protein